MPDRVNLGSGGTRFPGWCHIDLKPAKEGVYEQGEFIQADFLEGLPFADESLSVVFCEHVLEHLDMLETRRLAREVWRVLRRRGAWRIAVPDALYRPNMESPCEFGHKIMWCVDMLTALLRNERFDVEAIRAWRRSGALTVMPDEYPERGVVNRQDSLIVDAIKATP